jgi:RNA polymerase sigma factor (sigma-70 family)
MVRGKGIFDGNPQLLEAFRRGERWALERVYRAYVRRLDGYLHALARAAHAPELAEPSVIADSLQEIFVRALAPNARAAFDGERPYGPYLRRIARNFFVDRLRARGLALEVPFDVLPDASDGGPPEYDGPADPRVRAVLSAYLASLPPPLAAIYEQRFVLGNSQESSCAALRITRRRLRTDEARLLSGLRRALLENGIMRADWRGDAPRSTATNRGRVHLRARGVGRRRQACRRPA